MKTKKYKSTDIVKFVEENTFSTSNSNNVVLKRSDVYRALGMQKNYILDRIPINTNHSKIERGAYLYSPYDKVYLIAISDVYTLNSGSFAGSEVFDCVNIHNGAVYKKCFICSFELVNNI